MALDFLLDIIFPSACAGCETPVAHKFLLCENCSKKITLNRSVFCGTCRARLPELRKVCHKDSKYILGAATNYHGSPAEGLIKALKFRRNRKAAVLLGKILFEYLKIISFEPTNWTLVPLPLSSKREKERGFNQADLIAKELARLSGLNIETNWLRRARHSRPQSETRGRKERLENIAGSFLADATLISGKDIIILDDVTTSGATFAEAARALKLAGARKIFALAAAAA